MMNTIEKFNKILLVIFLMIQPILELILSLFKDNSFVVAGISIATIIRYGLLAIIIGIAVISNIKRKSTKFFIGYLAICATYIILHYLNIRKFDIVILGANLSKNFISIAMYISKFVVPICVLYLVYILKFTYKELKISIIFVVTFVSLLMIITNLFGIDYIAYSFENNSHLEGNILKWFDKDFTYSDWRLLTSRGLYPSGNELSALLALLLPIVIWIALSEKKNWYFIVVLLQMVAMLLIGTRIAVYGEIILMIVTSIIWLFDKFINKKEIRKTKLIFLIIVAIIFGILFKNSPFMNRIKVGEGTVNSYVEEKHESKIELTEEDNTPERIFVKSNYVGELIPYDIIERVYNYLDHTDFWVHIIKDVDITKRNNSRKLKTLILDDIEKTKDGQLDRLFGIGEIPIYPERDFVAQYYYIGVLGIILFLIPFVIIIMISIIYSFIKVLNKQFNGIYSVILFALIFIVGTAYLAGHVLEPIYINSFIALLAGMLLLENNQREKKEIFEEKGVEKYISKVYSNGKENFNIELENRLKENKKTFIVTANPETLMTATLNKKFDDCLMDENTTIVPDGIGVIKGAKLLNYDLKETITGVELCNKLFELGNKNEKSIYLFGAKDEVVRKLQELLEKEYPKMKIVGVENGYVEDKKKVFEKIKEIKPDIILVALGIPDQELLIYENYTDCESGIFMGVGGSFDVLSGTKKRAPNFFVKTHLEWLYRITVEPKRLKRFFKSNIKYVFKIIQER